MITAGSDLETLLSLTTRTEDLIQFQTDINATDGTVAEYLNEFVVQAVAYGDAENF